jgi:acyl carrier protein phosphodiesterase
MNYLAHAYLSYNHSEILVGNMVSDFVKGTSKLGFSGKVQKGITLHRDIDAFTDSHPETKKAKEIFRPHYRLYSGAIMDVLYDHFLANDESIFTETSLKEFTRQVYKQLELHTTELPERFVHVFTYMRTEDWLYHYRTKEGMRKSLAGLIRRAAYLSESETAYKLFLEHFDFLNDCYHGFFKDVKLYAKQRLEELLA